MQLEIYIERNTEPGKLGCKSSRIPSNISF